ncbi:hypothetical protein U27_05078 [Candidatus Vecturithrix granuli]|uniref:STAS/SEC14 domain-containing protein n=1 Tax=Vecturithrix granuli TaxID=1499967 RepID=A0A081C0K0_VECG1|nr:hypothetical protein U27_05078 [Candidatus Vecturithrix granuli]
MPVVQVNAELSFDQLVKAVAQLPQSEFKKFLLTVDRIHPLHEEHRLSSRESELLLRINQGIPLSVQQRYDVLIEKRDARTLTPEEYQELLDLTDQVELLDAKRMENIMELARLREQPLSIILEEFGMSPSTNA